MIGEQTEQPFSATEETLKIAKESGLEDIIKEVSNEQNIYDSNALFDMAVLMHNGAFEAVHIENGKFKRKSIGI